jgi:hypothetical protein
MNTAEIIRAIVGIKQLKAITCSVLQVNQQERTCDCRPLNGDADVFAVRLQADINSTNGFCIIPTVGSNVIIGFLHKNQAFIILSSEIDQIIINGGSLGGLVKVQDNVSKLNTLENSLNALKQILTTWVPVPNDGGAALKTAIASWASQQLTPTVVSDIEDTKVTH